MDTKQLLVIGAGPYGLAVAAYAGSRGLDYLLVGRPMEFWKCHMPGGLLLRSPLDWHLDPLGDHTFQSYLKRRGIKKEDAFPIPVELFLDYSTWFQKRKALASLHLSGNPAPTI